MSAPEKPLLVIQTEQHLSQDQRQQVTAVARAIAGRVGMEVTVLDGGLTAEVHRDFSALVMALEAQTEAINQLVISNMAIVEAMTESGAVDDEEQSGAYLDGSPR